MLPIKYSKLSKCLVPCLPMTVVFVPTAFVLYPNPVNPAVEGWVWPKLHQ